MLALDAAVLLSVECLLAHDPAAAGLQYPKWSYVECPVHEDPCRVHSSSNSLPLTRK